MMLVDNNRQAGQITVGGDKGYDTKEFVEQCRHYGITPHVAQNTSHNSAIDARATRHAGHAISQPQASRRNLRLGQDCRRLPKDSLQRHPPKSARGLLRWRGVQPGADVTATTSDGVTEVAVRGGRRFSPRINERERAKLLAQQGPFFNSLLAAPENRALYAHDPLVNSSGDQCLTCVTLKAEIREGAWSV